MRRLDLHTCVSGWLNRIGSDCGPGFKPAPPAWMTAAEPSTGTEEAGELELDVAIGEGSMPSAANLDDRYRHSGGAAADQDRPRPRIGRREAYCGRSCRDMITASLKSMLAIPMAFGLCVMDSFRIALAELSSAWTWVRSPGLQGANKRFCSYDVSQWIKQASQSFWNTSMSRDPRARGRWPIDRNDYLRCVDAGHASGIVDQTIVSTALPAIVGEFGGIEHLTWIVTAYLLQRPS